MRKFDPNHPVFSGGNAPVRIESECRGLEYEGTIPETLVGTYYRLAADPQFPPKGRPLLVEADGHVSAFHFREGGVVDFVSRFVRTERFNLERRAGRALFGTYRNRFTDDDEVLEADRTTANTAFLLHHGKLLACKEDGLPYEIDPQTLETIGRYDFGGQVSSKSLTAHAKIDPRTGELITYGSQARGEGSTDIAYYVFDADGVKTVEKWFKAPIPTIVHDFAVTDNWVAIPVMPVVVEEERLKAGGATYWWRPEHGNHIAVFRRDGAGDVRWFQTDPSYAFHVINAFERGDDIIIDLMNAPEFPMWWPRPEQLKKLRSGEMTRDDFVAQLCRWTLNPDKPDAGIAWEVLHPWEAEMPRMDDRFAMQDYRYAVYGVDDPNHPIAHGLAEMGVNHNAIGWWDHKTRTLQSWYTGEDSSVGEPVFTPRTPDADEGDGYILAVVQRLKARTSELVILDSRNVTAGPVATIFAPHRLKCGIHNLWIDRIPNEIED